MNSKFVEWLALPVAFLLQERGLKLAGQSGDAFWDWERLVMQVAFLVLLIRIAVRLGTLIRQAQTDREAREIAIQHLTKTADELAARTDEITEVNVKIAATNTRLLEHVENQKP